MSEDFEQELLKAMGSLQKGYQALRKEVTDLKERLDANFSFLVTQAEQKGWQCKRVIVTSSRRRYCTAHAYKSIAKGQEKNFVYVGGRHYPIPGGFECFVCTDWEKREDIK